MDITDKEFDAIKAIMYQKTGVFLKPTKKPLVVARLRKRLEDLDLPSFSAYIKILEDPRAEEFEIFINAITTNETFFFRHGKQFDFLSQVIFPTLLEQRAETHEITVWSAACSTGEEPYSLAIACHEFFRAHPRWRCRIFASDINSRVLSEAQRAVFPERSLKETPDTIKQKYFQLLETRDTRIDRKDFALNEDVKKSVNFLQHNLLKPFSKRNIDVIFLRNVMIYFDKESKQKVVSLLEDNLAPGGYFFISLSESLNDVESQLKFIQTGIYQKL